MNETTERPAIELPMQSFSRREERDLPAVQQPGPGGLLQAITIAAANPQIDIDKVQRLYEIYQKVQAREAETAFNAAMALAQAEIQPIVNNATNDHTHSGYAKLEQIDRTITPICARHGLSVSYDTETKNDADPIPQGYIRTIMWILHSGGHKERRHIDLPPDDVGTKGTTNKTMVQAIGSTNAYARRYLKLGAFNVSTFDDKDGNGKKKDQIEPDPEGKKALEACGSMKAFALAWNALSKEQRKTLHQVRIDCEAQIKEAERGAQA